MESSIVFIEPDEVRVITKMLNKSINEYQKIKNENSKTNEKFLIVFITLIFFLIILLINILTIDNKIINFIIIPFLIILSTFIFFIKI